MTNDQPFRVLLVDDSRADVVFISESMQDVGFEAELEVATDGRAALERLQAVEKAADQRPDLILLDLNLPYIGGLELLTYIKASDVLVEVPVIVLSTSDAPADIAAAYRGHASSYVVKPSDASEYDRLTDVLRQYWTTVVRLPSPVRV
ncbi:Two-component system response regulator [Euzebya pacifica]|uniref:Two-component system response regulator n=1 Tax=Euzebya pacifica TaxID=1608957 RepID=A0A346Y250_9ACTN|nr:response regulator [Euzebya pacifica]AXV08547.1 Two-component system response regulator [Euzebya pacifica]